MYCHNCGSQISKTDQFCGECGFQLSKSKTAGNYTYIIKPVIIGALLIFSCIVGFLYFVNTKIIQIQNQFSKIGVETTIQNSNSLLDFNREIVVRIENGRYFANFAYEQLKTKFPEYEKPLKNLFYTEGVDWEELLNGTTFDGQLTIDPFLLSTHSIDWSLKKLSNMIMREIKEDADASKHILPIFDQNLLGGTIVIDRFGYFNSITLNDIDKTFRENSDTARVQISGMKFSLGETTNAYSFDRLFLSIKDNDEKVNFSLDDFLYTINATGNMLNNTSTLKVGSFFIHILDEFNFTFKNFIATSSIFSNLSKVNANAEFSIDDVDIIIEDEAISFQNSKLLFRVSNLNEDKILVVIKDYNERGYDVKNYGEYELNNLLSLLNDNIKFFIQFNINKLNSPFNNASYADFNIDGEIIENTISTNNTSIEELKNLFNIDATLGLDAKTVEDLHKLMPPIENIFVMSKKQGNESRFDIQIKKSSINLNGYDASIIAKKIGDVFFEYESFSASKDFYKYAIDNGNSDALFRLAYASSQLGESDNAIKYYEEYLSDYPDFAGAMFNLSVVYLNGKGDYDNAIKWAKKALANGYEYGYFNIAYSYDMLKDYENAVVYYKLGLQKNEDDVSSLWNLGLIYEHGKGNIEKNVKEAIKLYRKAASLGDENAISKIKLMGW